MRISIISYLILLGCMLIFGCKSPVVPTTQETIIQEDTIQTLSLLFIGDVMGHMPQIKSALNPKTGKYDYEPCFSYVKPIIEKADLAIANLEVTLPGVPPYQGYPHFRSPDALGTALKTAGFDMLTTANNHSNDAGKIGLVHTLDVAKKLDFIHTGTFRNKEEKEKNYPLIVSKNSFKLAFLNYTYGTNGMPDIAPTMVNMIDTSAMKADIEKAKQTNPDAIIAMIHWGKEYKLFASKYQKKIANLLFEWGVDHIIGSHPHVIQPIERKSIVQADSSTKEGLLTYSLGNFISNQKQENTDGGLIVNLELVKDLRTKKVTLGNTTYSFVWRYIYNKKEAVPSQRTYYTIPISAFEQDTLNRLKMTKEDQKAMASFAKRFRKHLKENANIEEKKFSFEELYGENWTSPTAWTKPKAQTPKKEKKQTDKKLIKLPSPTNKSGKSVFKIQWQASKQKLMLKPPINVSFEIRKDGEWYQYLLGNETDRASAEVLLQKVKDRGYSKAYIKEFKSLNTNDIRL